ncbi:L-fuculose-phosphate aldolase [Caldicellulosiruptor bescii]|uniref:Class II aldolase/adducin family protein n=2 Tax=Caldicellulosiruptor bescii TaxID=31899 RepID=B9MP86_CALBD|nr:class II aldolase/adducin family protein [Caldicellulosiruptor bescii]ACM61645.1 class II aldolase/adducin family protein [Caldicellulosiruptor bescii DSM 6725]PBC88546.1 L-fuculose-phosphate aldolase [Caldicellulosiruptor bescii]PBC91972.1 L-fuculose-phosphate aldolase [Caldicellulosiruptor bescii]PBD02616.1 L-fuculose-phosphate aldolase [Caldicellulosiruptor bescii]PBD05151.1 L-fuculose-phosphate aldolase [Caldicellulosiruptor bescii]
MQDIRSIKSQICRIGRIMYERGYISGPDGNISVRVDRDKIITTPSGVSKGFLSEDMLVLIDMEGKILEKTNYKPSSEIKMHLKVYQEREDVNACVHAHSPYATTFAVLRKPLDKPILAESVFIFGGYIPVAPFATPSTVEVPESIAPFIKNYDAVLLSNHGVLTYDKDFEMAFYKLEIVEFWAKILFLSSQIGTPQVLSAEEIQKVLDLRKETKNA